MKINGKESIPVRIFSHFSDFVFDICELSSLIGPPPKKIPPPPLPPPPSRKRRSPAVPVKKAWERHRRRQHEAGWLARRSENETVVGEELVGGAESCRRPRTHAGLVDVERGPL